jgi:hypothetical protein
MLVKEKAGNIYESKHTYLSIDGHKDIAENYLGGAWRSIKFLCCIYSSFPSKNHKFFMWKEICTCHNDRQIMGLSAKCFACNDFKL